MSEYRPKSIAVVGAGDFGRRYVNALHDSSQFRLAGVAEQESSRRAEVALDCGVPTAPSLPELMEALGEHPPDGVIIATPPTAHLGDLELLVNRGMPALVEKPIVSDRRGLDFLRSLSTDQHRLIVPAHLSRHMDSVRVLRRIAHEQEIVLITAWRHVPRERLGLHGADHPALSAMIHDFDLIRSLTNGSIETLHVTQTRSDERLTHPDTVVATMTLDSGALITVGNSWTLPNSSRYVEARLEVVTTEEKFVLTTPSDALVVRGAGGDVYPAAELGLFGAGALGGAFERQLTYFSEIIGGAEATEVSVEEALWSIELALGVADWGKTD